MGHQQSTPSELDSTLAKRRYRMPNASLKVRRDTRKMGNVSERCTDMVSDKVNLTLREHSERVQSESNELLDANHREKEVEYESSVADSLQKAPYAWKRFQSKGAINSNRILLKRTERVLIENLWKRSRKVGDESIGARIFMRVLSIQPEIKFLFGLEKIPQGRLKYDPHFRKHASILTKTFEYIMKNLAYTEKLAEHFRALGHKHGQLQSSKAFKPEYWEVFFECIIQLGLDTDQNDEEKYREATVGWENLINFIIVEMRMGFDAEKTLKKR